MIEILPESKGNILAFKATEKLTTKDYEEVFIPKLNELIREYRPQSRGPPEPVIPSRAT